MKILELWEKHCVPSTNVIFERYTFHQRNQGEGESFDSYLTALRQLAATCDYGNRQDEFLRDKIVCGIQDDNLRKRLLQEANLDLPKCIAMSKAAEVSQQQLSQFKHENVHQVKDPPILKHCRYCGGSHQYGKAYCPAANKKCRKCGEMNHYEKMCRTHGDQHAQTGPSKPNRFQPRRSGPARTQQRRVHTVDEEDDDDQYEEVLSIQQERTSRKVMVKLYLENDCAIRMQVNSGATCNVIPEHMVPATCQIKCFHFPFIHTLNNKANHRVNNLSKYACIPNGNLRCGIFPRQTPHYHPLKGCAARARWSR